MTWIQNIQREVFTLKEMKKGIFCFIETKTMFIKIVIGC